MDIDGFLKTQVHYTWAEQTRLLWLFSPISAGVTIITGAMLYTIGKQQQWHTVNVAGITIIIIGLLMLPMFLFVLFSYRAPW